MAKTTAEILRELESKKPGAYTQSAQVQEAQDRLSAIEAAKPGTYESKYSGDIQSLTEQLKKRTGFSYDASTDPLYQNALKQAIRNGRKAMNDTIGDAQTLNGGYGTSYAVSAGNQQYNNYLESAQDKMPDYYALALDAYTREGEALTQKLDMYRALDSDEYGRYRDSMSDWRSDLSAAYTKYNDAASDDYTRYRDGVSDYINNRNFIYSANRDAVSDEKEAQANQDIQNQTELEKKKAALDYALNTGRINGEMYSAAITDAEAGDTSLLDNVYKRYYGQYMADSARTPGDTENSGVMPYGRKYSSHNDQYGNTVYTDEYGNEYIMSEHANPYTGTVNKDTEFGTFSNGYQPDNIDGKKLKATGEKYRINGQIQNVWSYDGVKTRWVWDGTDNKYHEIT